MQKVVNKDHNKTVLAELEPGDLIEFPRGLYSHWGVYIGNELIAHLAGDDNDGINADVRPEHLFTISGVKFDKAKVCIENFWNVVEDCCAKKNNKGDKKFKPLPKSQIIEKATSKLGEVGYSLIYSNCEHFASWCRYGVSKSEQVENVVTGAAVGLAGALTVGLVYAVSKFWGAATEKEDEEEDSD
ncbi:group XVI phospholipase a2 [Plakobranchus ocellatus]|uniref:Group XVI phospholipase a2 n=1 Tax=Plakobranchus ocellatus TaxID=259542 RepID=A0AAV4BQC3_9GAST|nr:group XVI phospholipase a2 [Plakobranchus ocellatus]